MGHLNSFSASGGGNLNKNFPKIQMPGGLPGGGCLSFDLTDILCVFILSYLSGVRTFRFLPFIYVKMSYKCIGFF